ncbi:MAG: AMP-binding protein [Rhodoferax sp.]|nr:AMP-binding protein [Rhodoferax sp.]
MHSQFRWCVPQHFNIAEVCCARWAARDQGKPDATRRVAIRAEGTGAAGTFHTYVELQQAANRLSNVLAGLGVARGDCVAIVMPQRFETAVAYMAVLQLGAVAMPLSMLFGPEALEYRLHDSEAVVAICDASASAALASVRASCPLLRTIVGVGEGAALADLDYADALAQQSADFVPVATLADDPAVLIYTSGTTGQPKGALIAHRGLIGNLSGFVCSQNWFGFDGKTNAASDAVFWSPADWAWTGGLMDALLPTLYFGREIVAYNGRFSPEIAFTLMQKYGVTHTFLFPTALKAMMKAYPRPRAQFKLKLQAIMSAGEAVGDAVFGYCQAQLGVTVNEMFGQTEINYIVGNCSMNREVPAAAPGRPKQGTAPTSGERGSATPEVREATSVGALSVGWPAKPGSMGKGYPGHRVAVIDEEGNECPVGVPGDVALNRFDIHGDPDPIFFLGYWKNPQATHAKFTGDWCRTGDLATRDADGYLWYEGRADDVFKAAGYRIGPGEIENCLVKHPAVANAAAVPKPDRERGALVKAYVVLAPDFVAARARSAGAAGDFDAKLVAELQAHVKGKLAPYEYPKEIEFIDALPMTTTGKVQRRVLRLQEEERFKKARV